MDEDTADLITALATQAAMIMEDVVDSALTMGKASASERTQRLEALKHAAGRIAKLIDAALVLNG